MFLTKLSTLWLYNTAAAFLGIYPKEFQLIYTQNPSHGFYNIFINNCQDWQATKIPSAAECINKLWYIRTLEYYSKLKRKELPSHRKTWRKLTCILLNERSQSEKATNWFQLCDILRKGKLWRKEKDWQLLGVRGEGGMTRQSSEDFSGSENSVML